MKKIIIALICVLNLTTIAQVSNSRVDTYWQNRVVPVKQFRDSTWLSFWNKVTDGIPTTTAVVTNSYVPYTGAIKSASLGLWNINANNYRARKVNVASSNSVTVLTINSARQQQLTGTTTHTFNLPNATTLDTNFTFEFNNNSTGVLTVANTSSTSLYNVPAGGYARVMNQNINTPNDTWDCHYLLPSNSTFGTNGLYTPVSVTTPTIWGSRSASGDLYLQSNSTSTVGEIYMKDQTFIYNKLNIGETGGTEGMIRWYGAAATTTNNILWETGIDVANSPVKTDLVLAAKVYSNGSVADLIYCKYNGTLQPVVSIPVDATETVATLALGIYGSNLQYDILKMTTRTGQTGKAIRVQNDALEDKFTVDRDGNVVALSYSAGVTGGIGKFYANDPASYAPEYQMLAGGVRKWTISMNAAFGMNFIDATGTVRFVLGQDGRLTAGPAADNGTGYIQGGLYGINATVVINGSRELLNITKITAEGSVLQRQGTDVASVNSMTLGTGGNSFEITGTTQINLLNSANWQNGSVVRLMFTSNPTVKHGQATSSTNITMLLNGAVDFVASSNDVLTLMLGEIGGVLAWREVSRSVN